MTRVLVVDDSALVRRLLTDILNSQDDLEVVGCAIDPFEAREKIKQLHPDVLTLDIEMPRMDGISFLRNLMRLRPMPVVMVSSLTERGAAITLEALRIGAVDYLAKPKADLNTGLQDYSEDIIDKVRTAAKANISALPSDQAAAAPSIIQTARGFAYRPGHLIAIGASTGGTEAIQAVLKQMPQVTPPIVITQHIPAEFSLSFAKRLDKECVISVFEAANGQELKGGCAYIAPGDQHLRIRRKGGVLCCSLDSGEPVNRHRPAVDVLFESVITIAKNNATGVLLTGMGADGARGLLTMREAGCTTIAQDEDSSVVWGMPGSAVRMNAATEVRPLKSIASRILTAAKAGPKS